MENLINYPCGMLDRDQRTILTISTLNKKYINENYIKLNKLNKFYKSDNNSNLINNNNNSNHINLCNNLNNNNNQEFKLIKTFNCNEKSTKILTKTRIKLKSLLICIIIFFLPLVNAKPLPHPNMDNTSNNGQDHIDQIPNDHNKKCQLLRNVRIIAKTGYNTILNELNNYTLKTYSLDHLKHHKEWIHHHNEALYPKQGRLNFDNYHESPSDEVFKHLFSPDTAFEEKFIKELLNVNERFTLILNGIHVIIKAKEADGNFNVEHDPRVMKFFKQQEKIIDELLLEIKMGLGTLDIVIPEINNNIIDYKNDGFDWMTISEYLKLLVYTIKAFKILQNFENCPME